MARSAWKYIVYILAAMALACAIMLLYIAYETRGYIYPTINDLPASQVAMVLGASVSSDGTLSEILKERADEALLLYSKGYVRKILVTGDNSTVAHNEVDPTARYLVAHGVAPQDIFLDHAGFDTYSSMYRAREVFGVTSVTIVSQSFHLPRAVYIARKIGLVAYGAEAGESGVHLFNYLREIPATLKAMWDVEFNRTPKYLGTQYPIGGDGRTTWGSATTTDAFLLQ